MNREQNGKILILSISDLSRDPRVYRQIETLGPKYVVHTAGKIPSGIEDDFFLLQRIQKNRNWIDTVWQSIRDGYFFYKVFLFFLVKIGRVVKLPMSFKEKLLLSNPSYIRFVRALKKHDYDLILANDFSSLSLAIKIRRKAKLLFDAHEYSLGQSTDPEWIKTQKPYIDYILNKYIRSIDAITTVSEGIAEQYARDYAIKRPDIITNAPKYSHILPVFHDDNNTVRMVHHGIAARQRDIGEMIKIVQCLDRRFTLDLYLVKKDEDYYQELLDACNSSGRVRLLEPIKMHELVPKLNEYDVGLYVLPPTSFNHLHALPNKIFEFVQARLAIAIGPSPEMARIVEEYGLGVVGKDFTVEAMVEALEGIDNVQLKKFKNNCDRFSFILSAEPQMEKLAKITGRIVAVDE